LPDWCEIRIPTSAPDRILSLLDAGERDAIQLALVAGFDTLLMDEMKGRREAQSRGLRVVGTISILETTSQLGLIEFASTLERLERIGFRLSIRVRDEFLKRNR
jgi:predicted nucleic acid-binding protein